MATGQDLWAELQLAYMKALAAHPDRAASAEAVFREADAMRCALMALHEQLSRPKPDELALSNVDSLYVTLHSAFLAYDALPDISKALFAFRSEPVNWLGSKAFSVIDCIRDAALQHLSCLQRCSLYRTLGPSPQMRETYPGTWFDAAGYKALAAELQGLAREIVWNGADHVPAVESAAVATEPAAAHDTGAAQNVSQHVSAPALPFGIHFCDTPNTIKRDGYPNPVTIRNETHWNLLKLLLKSWPYPVPEADLSRVLSCPNDRGNAKRLRDLLHGLGLCFRKWQMVEWDGQ